MAVTGWYGQTDSVGAVGDATFEDRAGHRIEALDLDRRHARQGPGVRRAAYNK